VQLVRLTLAGGDAGSGGNVVVNGFGFSVGDDGIILINVTDFNAYDTFTTCDGCSKFNLSFKELNSSNAFINYSEKVVANQLYFDYFNISDNYVGANISALPGLNKSASLDLFGIAPDNNILDQYLLIDEDDDKVMDESCPDSICSNILLGISDISFDVAHFTGYAYGSSANMTVYDEGDSLGGNQTSYTIYNVFFYADYEHAVTGNPITDASCIYRASDGYAGTMTYDGGLYKLIRQFNTGGTYSWNVTCTSPSYTDLITNDTITVTDLQEILMVVMLQVM